VPFGNATCFVQVCREIKCDIFYFITEMQEEVSVSSVEEARRTINIENELQSE